LVIIYNYELIYFTAAQSDSHCWSMYYLRKPNTELADSNHCTCISTIFPYSCRSRW